MSIIEEKEKNLNQLINKLNSITLTYSQPNHEVERIKHEKSEILRQGKYGYLVPVSDHIKFCKAIEYSLNNRLDKTILKKRGNYFDSDRISQMYLDTLM